MANDNPYHYLYNCKRWRELRKAHLSEHPLCEMCAKQGKVVIANTVDHIRPHKGNIDLMYDPNNLQSLDAACHSMHKQRQEKSGHLVGHDASGYPTDPWSHWNE